MIGATPRSSPAFAVGEVAHAFTCIGCGDDVPTTHFLKPRGICHKCCSEHEYEYDPYEREHRCTECDDPAPPDWYDVDSSGLLCGGH